MSKVITFRPITPKEEITYELKCAEQANAQSKMQCPKPIFVAMETVESTEGEPDSISVQYLCRMHATAKQQEVSRAVVADNDNYGLKEKDNV